jgi:hypothetical protein
VVPAVRLGDQVTEDPASQGDLQVVLVGVGEQRDTELQLRDPEQVRQEAVPAAAVAEQVEIVATRPEARAGDTERVPGGRARVRIVRISCIRAASSTVRP